MVRVKRDLGSDVVRGMSVGSHRVVFNRLILGREERLIDVEVEVSVVATYMYMYLDQKHNVRTYMYVYFQATRTRTGVLYSLHTNPEIDITSSLVST